MYENTGTAPDPRPLMSSQTTSVSAGWGEVPGRTLFSRLPTGVLVWLFHGMRPWQCAVPNVSS